MKLLIIDDEPELVAILAAFLKQHGHDCVTALDVQEAIRSASQHHPDLVITDYRLPDGDGFDVIRHIRQTFPQIPVILMTSYHDSATEEASRKAGAAAYLRKPFAFVQLTSAIAVALKGHRP